MTNQPTYPLKNKSLYSTLDLKLAALIMAELDLAAVTVEVSSNGNSHKKMIHIMFPEEYQADVNKLISDFINREARVDLFRLNKSLNIIRDKIKGV